MRLRIGEGGLLALAAAFGIHAVGPAAAEWYQPPPPNGQPVWGSEGKTGAAFMGPQWANECGANNPATGRRLSIYKWNPVWITAQCWYVPCPPGSRPGGGGGCIRNTGPIRG